MVKSRKPRPYDASGRRQRAAEARERALDVARRQFAERGYAETTMEAIATEAGLAVPTLYAAFGSKRGMLSQLIDRLVSGEPGGPSVLQTSSAKEVLAEPDRRRALALFAQHIAQVQERVGPTFQVMKSAARTEPDVAQIYARAQRSRFVNLEALAKQLAARGPLRPGLTIEDAGRTIWVLASPDTREMLRLHAGWSAERYIAWLADTLVAALLP
ncbi:MAG: TetR/AcrR family transcriptional regulator [Polyangiales bacterium]